MLPIFYVYLEFAWLSNLFHLSVVRLVTFEILSILIFILR
jgi:hypothetical protein